MMKAPRRRIANSWDRCFWKSVFLQQLGRGLRHAPEKESLTVLDFVGQTHPRYRIDRKFSALLRTTRRRIDQEIERDFPNLPPGCNIHLERVAREHVLANIRQSLGNLRAFIPEAIQTFEAETQQDLTFGNFVRETQLSPLEILSNRTWSEWKDVAHGTETVQDPHLADARKALRRLVLRTDPEFLKKAIRVSSEAVAEDPAQYGLTEGEASALHYLFWSQKGEALGVSTHRESFNRWQQNLSAAVDFVEIAKWRLSLHPFPTQAVDVGIPCPLRLHAAYGLREITAALENGICSAILRRNMACLRETGKRSRPSFRQIIGLSRPETRHRFGAVPRKPEPDRNVPPWAVERTDLTQLKYLIVYLS